MLVKDAELSVGHVELSDIQEKSQVRSMINMMCRSRSVSEVVIWHTDSI